MTKSISNPKPIIIHFPDGIVLGIGEEILKIEEYLENGPLGDLKYLRVFLSTGQTYEVPKHATQGVTYDVEDDEEGEGN